MYRKKKTQVYFLLLLFPGMMQTALADARGGTARTAEQSVALSKANAKMENSPSIKTLEQNSLRRT